MSQDTKERVSNVEKALEDFIRHTNRGFVKLQNAQTDLGLSLGDFKEEMRESRERSEKEMRKFKEEMRLSREDSKKEMQKFKEEMRLSRESSKKEMQEFKEEMRLSRENSKKEMQEFKNEMNKKWGELANRLGTLAEDFVAPNIPFIAHKYFQCSTEPDFITARSMRKHSSDKSRIREFDVIAVYEDKVILNETKSTARQDYINQFAEFIPQFYEYCPEYAGKQLIPIFAALYVNEQLIDYATKKGIYVLAIKEDTMDLLNYQQVADGEGR